jgi:putative SOS response-associated peptidase YedK
MCFYNSQNVKALALAKRYGRRSDVVEMAREIIEEKQVKKAFLHSDCVLVTGGEQLEMGKWGLIPFWIREAEKAEKIRNSTANAVSETVFDLPSFREAIRKRRCLIPFDGVL